MVRTVEESLPVDFACICLYDSGAEVLTVSCVGVHSEALAMELPVVAPALPGNVEVMADTGGMLIHPRDDVGAYADAIDQMITDAPLRRHPTSGKLCRSVE